MTRNRLVFDNQKGGAARLVLSAPRSSRQDREKESEVTAQLRMIRELQD